MEDILRIDKSPATNQGILSEAKTGNPLVSEGTPPVLPTNARTLFGTILARARTDGIIKILKKDGRTEKDNDSLYQYCQRLYFFKNFVTEYMGDGNESMVKKMISEVTFEEYPKNQIIFEEMEVSNDKMYVIISGTANVHKRPKTNVFENDFDKFTNGASTVTKKIEEMNQNSKAKNSEPKKNQKNPKKIK